MSATYTRIVWFDAFRGLSSLAVCAGHLRAVFFCDYAEITEPRFWHLPFYFLTGLGHQAVVVFFVMSGFLVGGSAIRNRHDFSWAGYGLARLSRLCVVLIPALIFTLLVDTCVASFSPEGVQGKYLAEWNSGPSENSYSTSARTFIGNLLFLQTIVVPVYGSNGPLWSLANEFWYYVLFPLLLGSYYSQNPITKTAYVVMALFIIFMLPAGILHGGVIWCLGALVYIASKCSALKRVSHSLIGVCLGTFIASLLVSKSARLERLLPVSIDFVVALAFAILIAAVTHISANDNRYLDRTARRLSDSSYSLYLFHFPVVFAIGSLLFKGNTSQPSAINLCAYLFVLATIVLFGHAVWYLFESRTDDIRRWLAKRLLGS